ncbi:MAG TPA: hypothetical protein VHM91_06995 [Verrucomicrobiales bacterium]|jgi:hypothetical protein|nr:hypothetical protein [Verrucomicrobiales bacterium]
MKLTLLAPFFVALVTISTHAADISVPGSTIVGGQLQGGTTFVVATVGTAATVNNYPGAETPAMAIDNLTGTKYLNFAETNTGYVCSPSPGVSNVTGIRFTTGNDSAERDPASYALYGTNAGAAGSAASLVFSNYTLISSGALSLPGDFTIDDQRGVTSSISFTNAAGNFSTYMLIFPTVKDGASANSMQIAEAVLTGTVVPEPSGAALGLAGGLLLMRRRRR